MYDLRVSVDDDVASLTSLRDALKKAIKDTAKRLCLPQEDIQTIKTLVKLIEAIDERIGELDGAQ